MEIFSNNHKYKDLTKMNTEEFRNYIHTLDIVLRVRYLEALEVAMSKEITQIYWDTFEPFDIQLLLESQTEIATRLQYIHQDICNYKENI
jgi:hypothetical protein